jgi:hypothetical protein
MPVSSSRPRGSSRVPLPPAPIGAEAVVVVRISMLRCASCCSFGTVKGTSGGTTSAGNARSTRQRCPAPLGLAAFVVGVHSKVSVPPATSAIGSVPARFGGRKISMLGSIGSMRTVFMLGLITRLGRPT